MAGWAAKVAPSQVQGGVQGQQGLHHLRAWATHAYKWWAGTVEVLRAMGTIARAQEGCRGADAPLACSAAPAAACISAVRPAASRRSGLRPTSGLMSSWAVSTYVRHMQRAEHTGDTPAARMRACMICGAVRPSGWPPAKGPATCRHFPATPCCACRPASLHPCPRCRTRARPLPLPATSSRLPRAQPSQPPSGPILRAGCTAACRVGL